MSGNTVRRLAVGILVGAMAAGGMSVHLGSAWAQAGPKPVVRTQSQTTITAVITAIDLATRHVTLQGPNGSVVVHANDNVNLDQLKVGDKVAVTYYQSLLLEGRKASVGDNTVRAMGTTQIADEQGQSGGAAGVQRTVTIVAKVYAIDKPKGLITLKGPQGNFRTFKVKDPSLLTHMTIGDNVVARYTEAWAVAFNKL
jgi:Cu/Ag efflux protein CusF